MAYPTDTIYGLGGRADLSSVCQTIDRLKSRPEGQAYSVALGSLNMLTKIISGESEKELQLLKSILPGPYTLIIRLNSSYRLHANQLHHTLGVRIPMLPPILELIETLGLPLISTSINRSGDSALNDPTAICAQFPGIDILLDAGKLPDQPPSTLLDLSSGQPYTILRRGAGLDRLISNLDTLDLGWRFFSA